MAAEHWITSWAQALTDLSFTQVHLGRATLRLTAPLSLPGTAVRVVLGNRFGPAPVSVGRAAVGRAGRRVELTFDGATSAVIPPGGELRSDPAPLDARGPVDVDVFLPDGLAVADGNEARCTWQAAGPADLVGVEAFPDTSVPGLDLPDGSMLALPTPLLGAVEVAAAGPAQCFVALGDSITAAGWPEYAAAELTAGTEPASDAGQRAETEGDADGLPGSDGGAGDPAITVVNAGISGNRLLYDGAGPFGPFFGRAGMRRLDHDVLGAAGVTGVIVALGVNDLGHPGDAAPIEESVEAEDLIEGLAALARRARSAGLRVLLATMTPFAGASMDTPERRDARRRVNAWVAAAPSAGLSDGVVDLAAAVADPGDPEHLAPALYDGDGLHPNEEGQKALGRAAARALRAAAGDRRP